MLFSPVFKKSLVLIFLFCVRPHLSFGVTGSITDPGFSPEQTLKESSFGPLQGSVKTRFSRHLRRSDWRDFFSTAHKDNLFDRLFIKTDLSLNYLLTESFPALKKSLSFNEAFLFSVLSYRRPIYDIPEVIKHSCFKFYFCFGEVSIGVGNSFKRESLKGLYSVYLNIPVTSKQSVDQRKIMGIGSSLSMSYPLFSKAGFQVSGISSHFFDTAVYGSRYANKQGSKSNDIFSVFNQTGLRFSLSGKSFTPVILIYISHLLALDYRTDWFQNMSSGFSAVWSIGKKIQVVAGLGWGGAVFQNEYTATAKTAKPFNPDETYINGGFIYSF